MCKVGSRKTTESLPEPEVYSLPPENIQPVKYDPSCQWFGVVAFVNDSKGRKGRPVDGRFQLHVWGGDVDRWVWVGKHPKSPIPYQDDVFLGYQPKDTYEYYFAQLYSEDGKPLTRAYPIRTYKNEEDKNKKQNCTKNQINLIFQRQNPQAVQ